MPSRWGPEGPPPDAYGRVTSPDRFAPAVDAADRLVERLVATYDVEREDVEVEDALRAVRLTPALGAPLVVAVTSFPGVRVFAGHWVRVAFPVCGCDACDEQPEEIIEQLHEFVGDVVGGRFAERLSR